MNLCTQHGDTLYRVEDQCIYQCKSSESKLKLSVVPDFQIFALKINSPGTILALRGQDVIWAIMVPKNLALSCRFVVISVLENSSCHFDPVDANVLFVLQKNKVLRYDLSKDLLHSGMYETIETSKQVVDFVHVDGQLYGLTSDGVLLGGGTWNLGGGGYSQLISLPTKEFVTLVAVSGSKLVVVVLMEDLFKIIEVIELESIRYVYEFLRNVLYVSTRDDLFQVNLSLPPSVGSTTVDSLSWKDDVQGMCFKGLEALIYCKSKFHTKPYIVNSFPSLKPTSLDQYVKEFENMPVFEAKTSVEQYAEICSSWNQKHIFQMEAMYLHVEKRVDSILQRIEKQKSLIKKCKQLLENSKSAQLQFRMDNVKKERNLLNARFQTVMKQIVPVSFEEIRMHNCLDDIDASIRTINLTPVQSIHPKIKVSPNIPAIVNETYRVIQQNTTAIDKIHQFLGK